MMPVVKVLTTSVVMLVTIPFSVVTVMTYLLAVLAMTYSMAVLVMITSVVELEVISLSWNQEWVQIPSLTLMVV
jgi:hypothetical protein